MRNNNGEQLGSTYSPPHPSRKDRRADSQSSTTSNSSSHLESSVTRLLVATKHLLEGLTQWSVGRQTEMQVSDIYVRLGNDFNLACMGFERAGIDMSELHSVPDDLRYCLETALSEEASPSTLEVHLPKIREIIIRLLQGLKTKQSRYRAMRSQERRNQSASPVAGAPAESMDQRQQSSSSGSTPAPPEDTARPDRSDSKSSPRLPSSGTPSRGSQSSIARDESNMNQSQNTRHKHGQSADSDSDAVSGAASVVSSRRTAQQASYGRSRPSQSSNKALPSTNSSSTPTSQIPSESPNSPPLPAVPPEISLRKSSRTNMTPKGSLGVPNMDIAPPPPPPPPPPANESLEALRKSEGLQRRASKRFSSYTFSKMTNQSSGVASSQNMSFLDDSPTEKDQSARELVSASRQRFRGPPSKEARIGTSSTPTKKKSSGNLPSPVIVTAPDLSTLSPTLEEDEVISPDLSSVITRENEQPSPPNAATPSDAPSVISTHTPSSFPIFLQLGRQVKKVYVDNRPSIASLRMLFTERFQYSPGYADFPGIYLRDSVTGIQYELEDVGEIKENSIISLNVEPIDEVKSQIDQGLANLAKELKEVKSALALGRRQSTVSGDLLSSSMPMPFGNNVNHDSPRQKSNGSSPTTPKREINKELSKGGPSRQNTMNSAMTLQADIENVRREIGGLRQIQSDFAAETRSVIEAGRVQASRVREIAQTKVGGARALVEVGKKKLDDRSQNLLTSIEALQDVIDDLKTDVVSRRIQPKESTLKTLQDDIKSTRDELDSVGRLVESVRPEWQRTWKAELQNVVDEQQLLKYQEELHSDLIADHDNIIEVFEQIKKYIDLRTVHGRSPKEFVVPEKTEDHQGLATVMLQVKGQTADSDKRLKAIEATERARLREIESRKNDEFKKELTGFVDSKMLKRIGGTDEAERIRALRDERNFKTMFSNQPISPQGSPAGPSSPQSNGSAQ